MKDNSSLPHEACTRYWSCNVNRCPLHLDFKKLQTHPKDPEQKCGVAKSIRKRIGKKYNLKNQGLFPKELEAMQRWDALPEELKEAKRQKMKLIALNLQKRDSHVAIKGDAIQKPYRNQPEMAKTGIVEEVNTPKKGVNSPSGGEA